MVQNFIKLLVRTCLHVLVVMKKIVILSFLAKEAWKKTNYMVFMFEAQTNLHTLMWSLTNALFLFSQVESNVSVMDKVLFELFSVSSMSVCRCNNRLMVSLELLRNVPFQFEHKCWFDCSPAHQRQPIRDLLCSFTPPLPHPHLSAFKPSSKSHF